MKVFLMFNSRDYCLNENIPPNVDEVVRDLELETLFKAMAAGDDFLHEVVKDAVLSSLAEPNTIIYRQHVLRDCLAQPQVVRALYRIAVEAIEGERKVWGWKEPASVLRRSTELLEMFVPLIKRLRQVSDKYHERFRSEGFKRLFSMLSSELDDSYLRTAEEHIAQLTFRHGMLMSAELGKSLKGANYVLCKLEYTAPSWAKRIQGWIEEMTHRDTSSYILELADRDEAGFRALSELKEFGIVHVAAALALATDHILSFFQVLRCELAFYVGCLNLRDKLAAKGESICFPDPVPGGQPTLSCQKLYDICLSLSVEDRVIGNDVSGSGKLLVMITGANRGGKSTLLRSIGLAQVMMQCGMFVAAEGFTADLRNGIFTHFKREEDPTMRSGKFDEELSRMSSIVDEMNPASMVLLNESFASTNEREGSEIARQIVSAFLETGVKVLYVTHLYDLAHGFHLAGLNEALFLRAERLENGVRTFRLLEGEPLPTSYGQDLYQRIFVGPTNAAELSTLA